MGLVSYLILFDLHAWLAELGSLSQATGAQISACPLFDACAKPPLSLGPPTQSLR